MGAGMANWFVSLLASIILRSRVIAKFFECSHAKNETTVLSCNPKKLQ